MLEYDPDKRISTEEAAQHPFIKPLYNKAHWDAPLPQLRYDPDIEMEDKSIEDYRGIALMY